MEKASIPETVMTERCKGCAMRSGTEANTADFTQLTLSLCIETGTPFHCHDGNEGHLCRGFHDAFVAKVERGDYEKQPKWKNDLAIYLLGVLARVRQGETPDIFEEVISKIGSGV